MSLISNLTASTELEAVNAMLAAGGIAPYADLTTLAASQSSDAVTAISTFRNTAREVLAKKWRFNSEFGLALTAATTTSWTDPDGTVITIGIFTPPTGLASFEVSSIASQVSRNGNILDVVLRPSRVYSPGTMVFYDRETNRDGFPTSERTKLWIDAVWFMDFTSCPETVRRYITVVAGRRFLQAAVGATELVGFTAHDEAMALRDVAREQGLTDDVSMLDHPDVGRVIGNRPRTTGLYNDSQRSNP